MKLGTLLLRNAAIGLTQLEAALKNQVLYGGRLGTNLVELGLLDLEALSGYLGELGGVPVATPTLLDGADRALLDKLGSDEAHRLRAIPLHRRGDTVAVAMVDPSDAAARTALADALGAPIAPHVVPELRALYYLEKLYGLSRRARFVRTARPRPVTDPPPPAAGEAGPGERRRSQPAAGLVMPPALTLEPRRRRTSSQAPMRETGAPPLTFAAACRALEQATERDQIAETLVEYGRGRVDALVVFLVRDGNANGWRAHGAVKAIDEISLPLGGASSLQSAHDGGQPFVGPPPAAAKPIELQLWQVLGAAPEPIEVAVVPILVKGRPVNLIYVHVLGGAAPSAVVTELTALAERAEAAYGRLIQRSRRP